MFTPQSETRSEGWHSDMPERIHKPVEEIKTSWTVLLTDVPRLR